MDTIKTNQLASQQEDSRDSKGVDQRHILYSFRRCPYAMRARMAIVNSGLSCYIREVSLRAKPLSLIQFSSSYTAELHFSLGC